MSDKEAFTGEELAHIALSRMVKDKAEEVVNKFVQEQMGLGFEDADDDLMRECFIKGFNYAMEVQGFDTRVGEDPKSGNEGIGVATVSDKPISDRYTIYIDHKRYYQVNDSHDKSYYSIVENDFSISLRDRVSNLIRVLNLMEDRFNDISIPNEYFRLVYVSYTGSYHTLDYNIMSFIVKEMCDGLVMRIDIKGKDDEVIRYQL